MYQVIIQTREQKIEMYMDNCSKKELAEMLYECNELLSNLRPKEPEIYSYKADFKNEFKEIVTTL